MSRTTTACNGHPSLRLLATRVLPGVTLLFAVTVSDGCSEGKDRRAMPHVAPAMTLDVPDPIDHLDVIAREPMVAEHADGTLFVAGYGESTPTLWKSRDRGASWARVDVGPESRGAIGNSDVDLAVAGDGTIHFVTMVFDRNAGEGASISVGVSKDIGATWSWTLLSKTRFDDRPWVEVGADGTVHVIWNDGRGVCHAVSEDGGGTWTERPRIHAQGGSSHLAVGPNGELAVGGAARPGHSRRPLFSLGLPGGTLAGALVRSRRDLDDLARGRRPRRAVLPLSDRARPRRAGGDMALGARRDAPGACGQARGRRC